MKLSGSLEAILGLEWSLFQKSGAPFLCVIFALILSWTSASTIFHVAMYTVWISAIFFPATISKRSGIGALRLSKAILLLALVSTGEAVGVRQRINILHHLDKRTTGPSARSKMSRKESDTFLELDSHPVTSVLSRISRKTLSMITRKSECKGKTCADCVNFKSTKDKNKACSFCSGGGEDVCTSHPYSGMGIVGAKCDGPAWSVTSNGLGECPSEDPEIKAYKISMTLDTQAFGKKLVMAPLASRAWKFLLKDEDMLQGVFGFNDDVKLQAIRGHTAPIMAAFDGFDLNKNKKLSEDEFFSLYEQHGPQDHQALSGFNSADKNKDGELSVEEVKMWFRELKLGISPMKNSARLITSGKSVIRIVMDDGAHSILFVNNQVYKVTESSCTCARVQSKKMHAGLGEWVFSAMSPIGAGAIARPTGPGNTTETTVLKDGTHVMLMREEGFLTVKTDGKPDQPIINELYAWDFLSVTEDEPIWEDKPWATHPRLACIKLTPDKTTPKDTNSNAKIIGEMKCKNTGHLERLASTFTRFPLASCLDLPLANSPGTHNRFAAVSSNIFDTSAVSVLQRAQLDKETTLILLFLTGMVILLAGFALSVTILAAPIGVPIIVLGLLITVSSVVLIGQDFQKKQKQINQLISKGHSLNNQLKHAKKNKKLFLGGRKVQDSDLTRVSRPESCDAF